MRRSYTPFGWRSVLTRSQRLQFEFREAAHSLLWAMQRDSKSKMVAIVKAILQPKGVYGWSLIVSCMVSTQLFATTDWQAIVCNPGTNEVYQITLPLDQAPVYEDSISWVNEPHAVTISPDATRAIVTGVGADPSDPNIFSLGLTTVPPSVVTSRTISQPLTWSAISPDGSRTYSVDASHNVNILKTSDLSSIDTIPSFEFSVSPFSIALSPNKPEGYIATEGTEILVINTDTNTVSATSYDLPPGVASSLIAVTPDGSEAYVIDFSSETIYRVILSDGSVSVFSGLAGAVSTNMAIAPDGSAVYVLQSTEPSGGSANVLLRIDTLTHVISTFTIPSPMVYATGLAITPDGKMACITDLGDGQLAGQYIAFLNTTTGASVAPPMQLSTSDVSSLSWVAITPDQAPTAGFTYSICEGTATFNASSSSSPTGQIATYAWDFGDGQGTTTSSAAISHTYTNGGSFDVTLTVTNTAGTSTAVTYTGAEVGNNGGSSARTSQRISLSYPGIAKFEGKVYRNRERKEVHLKTKWSKSLVPHARKYIIFAHGKKIATIKAHKERKKVLKLHPHTFPLFISYDYRQFLDHKYSIRVVDNDGHVSRPTFLHVVKKH